MSCVSSSTLFSRVPVCRGLSGLLLLAAAPCAWATDTESSAYFGLLKVVLSLGVIIVAIYLVLGFARRMTMGAGGGQGLPLRVRGGVMVGQRERVVVVEVNDTWLVLGVTASQVSLLHTLPREEGPPSAPPEINPQKWVQQWLARSKSANPGAKSGEPS